MAMELTIEKLKKIDDHDYPKLKTNNKSPPSDLGLKSLNITLPVPQVSRSELSDPEDYEEAYFSDDYQNENEKKPEVKENVKVVETVQEVTIAEKRVDLAEKVDRLRAFTVRLNDTKRIITINAGSKLVVKKWMAEILRSQSGNIIVGVIAELVRGPYYFNGEEAHYDIIALCVGSQCLVFELPDPWDWPGDEKPFVSFFANPRVIAAGVKINVIAKKLLKDHGIKVTNTLDLNEVAQESSDLSAYDMKKCDLDKLATMVLGKEWYVDRPKKVAWREGYDWGFFCKEKLMYTTYDAYLCFEIGSQLIKMKSSDGKKSKKKRAGTKN